MSTVSVARDMANYFTPTSEPTEENSETGVDDDEEETKVKVESADEDEDEAESNYEYYSEGYHEADEFKNPGLDPLEEVEEKPSFQNGHLPTVIPGAGMNRPSSLGIHPFTLPIPRLHPPPKPILRRRKIDGIWITFEVDPDAPLPPQHKYSIEEAETTVRNYIDNSLSSRKDPKGRHLYYRTIHQVLNEALHQNLISPTEVDSYWKKFDDWATSANSYRLGDHYMLQYSEKANDSEEDAPRPTRAVRRKKGPFKQFGLHGRALLLAIRHLENHVKCFVLKSNLLPLRDDLYSRIMFYKMCHKYYRPGSELFLDFYWNALINRKIEYYDRQVGGKRRRKGQVALPPSPKKMKFPPPTPEAFLDNTESESLFTSGCPSTPKHMDMDRLVKLVINSCVTAGKDPLASHKFYWTIHRSLETVQSLNLSQSQINALWKKYDSWAYVAFSKNKPYPVEDAPHLYSDVRELPPVTTTVAPTTRPPELYNGYPRGVREFLSRVAKDLLSAQQNSAAKIRNDLTKRRFFFETYVNFVEPGWSENLIDGYWRTLLGQGRIRTLPTQVTSKLPPRQAKVNPRFEVNSLSKKGTVKKSFPNVHVPKKFDMDRLIQLCINECLQLDKDPMTTHKFYWTIHRSLETVSSLNLSKRDVDLLWQKYNKWADEAFNTGIQFTLDYTHHEEYYSDVTELPVPPKAGRSQASYLSKLQKLLDKTVRETIIAENSQTNLLRGNLKARRNFLESYVMFVPTESYSNSAYDWIDGYWTRLLWETKKDYKLYMKLGEIVGKKMNQELNNSLKVKRPKGSTNGTAVSGASASGQLPVVQYTNTASKNGNNTNNGVKLFSGSYLVKKVINAYIGGGQPEDPRTHHKFYWTIHRCVVECDRLRVHHQRAMTSSEINELWKQYDELAEKAFATKSKCNLESELKFLGTDFYKNVNQLPVVSVPTPPATPLAQLFPNCPKSSALAKYLDRKVRRTLTNSNLVGPSHNHIVNDLKTRLEFFQDYLPYVEEMQVGAAMISSTIEKLIDDHWTRLLTETHQTFKTYAAAVSRSTASPFTIILTRKGTEPEVPCIDID